MRKINKNFYSKLGIFCVLISCFSCSNQTDPIFNSSSLKSITSEVIRLKSDPKISKKYLADSLLSKTQEMVKDKNIEIRDREISNAILLCGLLYKVEGQYDNAKDAYLLAKKHSDANSIQHAISSLTLAQISGDDKKFDEAISNFANLTKNFTEINFENVEAANAKVLYKTFLGAFVEYIYLHRLHRTGTQYSDTAVAIECILEWLYEFNTLFDFDAINKEYKIDGIRKFVRECSDMYIKSENNERARQVYKKFSQLEENNVVDKVDKLWLKFKFLINTTESSNERFNQVKNIYENMPESNKRLVIMNHLASYSKGIGNYDYHKEILKKLAASKIIRNSKSDEIYYRPIRAAVLNLALIYLKENDWEQAKKYLDVLESKYRDTDEYQTAKEADMWKWLSEIKS